MITQILTSISAVTLLGLGGQLISPILPDQILAQHEMPLNDRYPVKSVSDIFKDNILLNMAYLDGTVKDRKAVNWSDIEKPFTYEFKLEPGQTFAFQDDVLPQYQNKVVKTTNAHFNSQEGFKSDGYLVGDGVCHLASLMYWVAKDAGLDAYAPTNHDFMPIPEIAREFGVAIYANPYTKGSNAEQNLYITNNKDKTVTFKFEYKDDKLTETILEDN